MEECGFGRMVWGRREGKIGVVVVGWREVVIVVLGSDGGGKVVGIVEVN